MSKKKETKKLSAEQLKKIQDDNALKQLLKQGADELVRRKSSDELLDLRIEKIELASGKIIIVKELMDIVQTAADEYGIKFVQEWYREVFRLNGWRLPKSGKIWLKPSIVGKYTNDIIYGRFPKEVLPELQKLNKDITLGIRLHKHFQYLTKDGSAKVEKFIDQSLTMMRKCTHWSEFQEAYAKEYGLPFNQSIFDSKAN